MGWGNHDDFSLRWFPCGVYVCRYRGKHVHLSPLRANLLSVLAMNRGRIISRDELIEAVYTEPDREPDSSWKIISVTIFRLRLVLPGLIKTEIGRGFYIDRPEPPQQLEMRLAA